MNDPLRRASGVTDLAASVGFDWPDIEPVFEKVREELAELEEAAASGEREHIAAELGDVLFTVVNLARFLDVEPSAALDGTTARFEARFAHVVRRLAEMGRTPERSTLEEMDRLWREAKALGIGVVKLSTQGGEGR